VFSNKSNIFPEFFSHFPPALCTCQSEPPDWICMNKISTKTEGFSLKQIEKQPIPKNWNEQAKLYGFEECTY